MENHITLYFRQGSSDKVYQSSIRPQDGGYMVDYAYGRRGSTLSTGRKTSAPVEYQIAKGIYDKLIREKVAKGYRPGADAPGQLPVGDSKQPSGIQCQLLNAIEREQADQLLSHPDYWMQEKWDGRRLLIQKEGNTIKGINRLGFFTSVPEPIAQSAGTYRGDFLLDGEAVGDTLHVFDLLTIGGEDLRALRFAVRFLRLRDLLSAFDHPHIQMVDTYSSSQKGERYSRFECEGKEGVVFKHIDAPYDPGRPNSGGPQLKYKFYETASFIVAKANPRRSVSLILFDGENTRSAGNVTIPPNHEVPSQGAIVECRYLYAFKESGSIYQPVFLGTREDIPAEECTTAQLKYKVDAA